MAAGGAGGEGLKHLAWTFDWRTALDSIQERSMVAGAVSLAELSKLAWEVAQGAEGDAWHYLDESFMMPLLESEWEEQFGGDTLESAVTTDLFAVALAPFMRPAPALSRESVIALQHYYCVGYGSRPDRLIRGELLETLVTRHGDYRMLEGWSDGFLGWLHVDRYPRGPVSDDQALAAIRQALGDQAADAVRTALDEVMAMRRVAGERGEALALYLRD